QQLGAPVGVDRDRGQSARRELHLAGGEAYLTPVDARQQLGQVGGHDVDDVLLQSRGGRQARRTAHRLLRPVGVAATQLRQAADVRDRVVHHLVLHGAARRVGGGLLLGLRLLVLVALVLVALVLVALVLVALVLAHRVAGQRHGRRVITADGNRGRGAEVGGRRHGGNVAGVQDIGAGAGGPGARRRHVGRHGNGRRENRADDIAHGAVEAARGIHL